MSRFRRETFLLTLGVNQVLDNNYVALLRRLRVLQVILTNLRNRPLDSSHISAMSESILSLFHNFVTGSRDFPLIPSIGFLDGLQLHSPFPFVWREETENAKPNPLTLQPAGVMVPTAGYSSSHKNILTPAHPEKAEVAALRADWRNSVRTMLIDSKSVTRVIATVHSTEGAELANYWRVSDYSADGHILMSVLCKFTTSQPS
ncbi:hypothetical protein Q5P01_003437 [Channa striata]|uniref:Uncharacterized protein n=1 Tax=Channa striata TaxID=64152 RepID=A0AA88NHR6_CHASR|nr:hypothetical protein Q5P01_003437 [Channa striata]